MMHHNFFSSALLLSAVAHFTSAQVNITSASDSAQPTGTDGTQDSALSSAEAAIDAVVTEFASAYPSLLTAAESALFAAVPTGASPQLLSDLVFNPADPEAASVYSKLPPQYVGILTSLIAAESSAVIAVYGSATLPGVSATDDTSATQTGSLSLLPTRTGSATPTLETLTTSATVSGSASGLTTITTAPQSEGSSTTPSKSESGSSSSGASSRTVSAASGASSASTTASTAAAASMQTGGLAGLVVAAVGVVGAAIV